MQAIFAKSHSLVDETIISGQLDFSDVCCVVMRGFCCTLNVMPNTSADISLPLLRRYDCYDSKLSESGRVMKLRNLCTIVCSIQKSQIFKGRI